MGLSLMNVLGFSSSRWRYATLFSLHNFGTDHIEKTLQTVLQLLRSYPLPSNELGILNVFTQPLPRNRQCNQVTVY
jgi:hypothetical protein